MKKQIIGLALLAVGAVSLPSCDSYFDDVPNNATTLDDIFTNRGMTLGWLTNMYSFYPNATERYAGNTAMYWNGSSIEGYLPWDWVETHDIIQGTLNPSTGFAQRLWKQCYIGITNANIYLANVDKCNAMPDDEKATTKAEVRAFRSFFYLYLMKLFGPAQLMGDHVSSNDDPISFYQMPRNTVDECFDYIISEFRAILDEGSLHSSYDAQGGYDDKNKGNFTKETVEMLLCDAYLFRASYLYNGFEYYQDVANNDGTLLFPQQRDEQKWRDLKTQAKKIIDSGKYRLVLRDLSGKPVNSLAAACPFKSTFYASMANSTNEELIFGRTNSSLETYSMVPRFDGCGSETDRGGGAQTIPLEFIDLYLTNKGLRIEDDPDYFTYDVNDPPVTANARDPKCIVLSSAYKDPISGYEYFKMAGQTSSIRGATAIMKQFYNREARFYLAVTFQNRPWDFKGGIAVQMQRDGNSGSNGTTHDYPIFGTILRKGYYAKESNWDMSCEYRLAEVYLDYAEACAELGETDEALKYVNHIRNRAGIAEYGLRAGDAGKDKRNLAKIELPAYDKETVLKAIYRERILELAYENKHYFDVRRWCVADGNWRGGAAMTDGWVYPPYHVGGEGGDMTGFNVNAVGQTDANKDFIFYKRVKQQERVFTKRMYLLPIPQEEINRNKVCVQNKDW